MCDERYYLWKLVKSIRKLDYHRTCNHSLRAIIYERRKNRISRKCGSFIEGASIGKGLKIWHGDIMIHSRAVIGENCQLHGRNCIGNKGTSGSGVPTIGNNVDIGVRAILIGDIVIADNITIAANAVVTKSCLIEGAVLAGVPATIVEKPLSRPVNVR